MCCYVSWPIIKKVPPRSESRGNSFLVNLCIEKKIEKLVYISSIAALGSQTTGRIDENTPWNPTIEKTPYAYSKYGAELEVWRAGQEGVPIAMINPGVILGTGMPRGPLEQLVNQIKSGLRFYTLGSTGYVAVEDVIDVVIQLMNSISQMNVLSWSQRTGHSKP